MITARLERQLVATLPARMGLLAEVSGALKDAGVDIRAISAYERDGVAKFLIVTGDVARSAATLGSLGADVSERTAVAITLLDEPGTLQQVASRITDAGINIFYIYGTADESAERATIIFKTADDEKVVGLF